jgi:hypothetical protein
MIRNCVLPRRASRWRGSGWRPRPVRGSGQVEAYLTTELDVTIPQAWELQPQIDVDGFEGTQPYRLALVGEKSSLADILGPLADRYDADLFLPTGEISDTQIYLMARAAEDDGRPLAVLYFADCDPAGWQMGISVSRKLQAFRYLLPKMPDFEVHRVALTPAQVQEYGLPSTPLKATETRADPWRAAMGIEQTEIDALASLRQAAEDAIRPFYDRTLGSRVAEARRRWLGQAQAAVERAAGAEQLQAIRADAADQLENMRQQILQLNAALRMIMETSSCRGTTYRRRCSPASRPSRSSTRDCPSTSSASASSHRRHIARLPDPRGEHDGSGRYPDHDRAHSGLRSHAPIGVAYAECRRRELPSEL